MSCPVCGSTKLAVKHPRAITNIQFGGFRFAVCECGNVYVPEVAIVQVKPVDQ